MSTQEHHDEYGESTSKRKVVVDGGELRPGHLRARKSA